MSQFLSAADRVSYDDGWTSARLGINVGEIWQLMPPAWHEGFKDGLYRGPLFLFEAGAKFSVSMRQYSKIVVHQGVLSHLRGGPRPDWATKGDD